MHMLQKQTYPIGTILIVNTEKKFFPEKGYETWQNVQIRHIETEDFDHGGTRDGAASLLDGDLIYDAGCRPGRCLSGGKTGIRF